MVRRLGFVQVDNVSTVERAHHHILFSRDSRYRQQDLGQLLEHDRTLFENWTHDAAILPAEVYPYWRHYFQRVKRFEPHPGYRRYFAQVTRREISKVLRRVTRDGPLRPRDFQMPKAKFRDDYFAMPSLAKLTLEYLWRIGKLAVSCRSGREKVYDLARRVIPREHYDARVSRTRYVDWACREALARMVVGSPARVSRFFDAISKEDAAAWCRRRCGTDLREIRVKHSDGSESGGCFALVSTLDLLAGMPPAPRALRLLNPFDPLIHDRRRTQRIFGFDYAVEIWVPQRKRRYGYYVLPILEGQRFTGRVDIKADRKVGRTTVLGLWWEEDVDATRRRMAALERELCKLARFADAPELTFARGYARR